MKTSENPQNKTISIPDALNLAQEYYQKGLWHQAEDIYRQILEQGQAVRQPKQEDKDFLASIYSNLGATLKQQNKLEEARAAFLEAIQLNPDYAEAHNFLGLVLKDQEKLAEAGNAFRQSIELKPDYAEAYNNLGVVLKAENQLPEAIATWRKAIEIKPDYVEVYHNLGNALTEQEEVEEALAIFHHAIQLKPDFPHLYNGLGNILLERGELEAAIAVFQYALNLKPDYAEAYNNLGIALRQQGKPRAALDAFCRAIECQPNLAEANVHYAWMLLLLGDLRRGFIEYEWRWQTEQSDFPLIPDKQIWHGSNLKGRSILLISEQGFGDTLQFSRYAPILAEQGATVKLACQASLVELLKSLEGISEVMPKGEISTDFDVYLPLMSVPRILKTTLETMPATIPYIFNQQTVPKSIEVSPQTKLKVGIVWATGFRNRVEFKQIYQEKSCPLEFFLHLLSIPGVSLYSLQVGRDAPDIQPYLKDEQVHDLSPQIDDFADTAALLEQLDLIISVDTAVAHLAGAMGKPVWTLLPFAVDWRWLLERDDSPWYPTMRLFRQPRSGDWVSIFRRVKQKLQEVIEGESPIFPLEVQKQEKLPLLPKTVEKFIAETAGKISSSQPRLKRIIDSDGFNAVVRARYGYMVYNKNDIYIGRAIEKYGEFSEFEIDLFRQICSQNDVVVEVGANIGTHTIALAEMVGQQGRVYAFEPQRIVFQTLCANMSLNSVMNVECFQVAAASKLGFLFIPDLPYDREGNFGGVSVNVFNQGVKVPQVKLDDFLEISKLKLLKIDVEGMESEVILGAKKLIKKYQPILYVENDRIDKSKELITLIRSLGYQMYWHLPYMYNPNNFFSDAENIYPGILSSNMLCLPKTEEFDLDLTGMTEVTDPDFHPMKRSS